MSLRRLSLASIAGCLIGLLLLGGFGGKQLQRMAALQAEMGQLLGLQARIDQFNAASDSRWLLQADERLWEAFRDDARALQRDLRGLGTDAPGVAATARRIGELLRALAAARERALATADDGVSSPATILRNHLAMQGMALDTALDEALDQRRGAIARQADRAAFLFAGAALLFGLACLAAFGVMHRRISRPVSDLLATVDRLRQGEARARTAVDAGDELGRLGRAINHFAEQREAADARIRAQHDALAYRERMLADSQRLAAIGSWRLCARTHRLDWSAETYRLAGVSAETFTPTPEAFFALVHPADRDRLIGVQEAALAGERTHDATFRLQRPDGAERIVHELASAERNAAGELIALAGTIQDVTERRVAERRNEQYRRLLDASRDLFCIIDDAHRYVMVTEAYAGAYALDRGGIEGRALDELFEADFLEREVLPPLRRCLEGEEQRFESERVFPETGRRQLVIHYFPIPGERPGERLAGVSITDITDFRRAENELQEQARLLSIAGRAARFGGWSVDPRGGRVRWSDMVAEIHGMPPGYSPTVEEGLDFYAPEHRDRIEAAFRACVEAGEPFDEELQIIDRAGQRRWVRCLGEAVQDAEGIVTGVQGAFQDIEVGKQREERLADYRALIENSRELFKIGDADYRYTLVNRAYAELYGADPGAIVGRPIRELVGPREFDERVRPYYDRALAGERVEVETEREDPERGPRRILVRYYPIESSIGATEDRHVGAVMTDITALKEAQVALRRVNARLENILESITDAFLTVDREWCFQYVNAEAGRLMGCPPQDMLGRNAWDLFPDAVGTPFEETFRRAMDTREPASLEEYYAPFGLWLDVRIYPTDEGLALYFRDASERHRIQARLREQEEALRENRDELARLLETRQALINALPAHIALLDGRGEVLDVNDQWRHYGTRSGNADPRMGIGRNYLEICDAADGDCAGEAREAAAGIRSVLAGDRETFTLEYPCHPPVGEQWFRLMTTRVHAAPNGDLGAVVMHVDVTERKQAEQRLNRLAFEDPLTGLHSRQGVVQAIEEHLERHGWQPHATVLILDLRDLRDVNDVYGFGTGDRLLRAVGERLVARLGRDAVVGRVGGDEFVAFLQGEETERRTIEEMFRTPFEADDSTLEMQAHLGYTELGPVQRPVADLLREAELALFQQRQEGGAGAMTRYTAELDRASHHRIEVTRELRRALAEQEFQLHFQPKVQLADGAMESAEALIRWLHPERGLRSPGEFIPIAEQSQLIGPIGDWAVAEACRLLRAWQDEGLDIVRIAVNVSQVQFTLGDFAATVTEALESHDIAPSALTLEITESVFERESERLLEQLRVLHDLGVRLSLDDFGTGYSSLLYLQRYPFDEIKIDQGFVRRMLEDDYSRRIVTTVASLAQALGAEVVAEGIEDTRVSEALQALGCRIGQGYYYSMPLEPEDFRWLLQQQSRLPLAAQRRPATDA